MVSSSHPAAELFRLKSKTFSLASKLFAPDDRAAVARLYSFCRQLDDLADDTSMGERGELENILNELRLNVAPTHPITVDFRELAEKRGLSLHAARMLTKALHADCGPQRIASETQLIQFAFGVAGTVGLLMCPVLGVNDERSLPFAIDLGIALQLTNIGRDIVEDAHRDRYYLPSEWIKTETVDAAIQGSPKDARLVDESVHRLLELAEQFYESAFRGHWFIPPRNRRAVFLATRLYREIGQSLLKMGSGKWRVRRSLSLTERAVTTGKALYHYQKFKRENWSSTEAPTHDSRLNQLHLKAGIQISNYASE
ncbi:MAG: phytoene/squalene synthase family protein [Lentimonas sp.]